MRHFDELTQRGKALRLRPLAESMLRQFEIEITSLRSISNTWNGIFKVRATDGKNYALRISRPGPGEHTLDEMFAETDWMSALAKNSEIEIPKPIPSRNGAYVVTEEVIGVPESRHAILFRWAPGVDVSERITTETYCKMGELTARLHQHAEIYQIPNTLSIRKFNSPFPFSEDCVIGRPEYKRLFPPKRLEIYQETIDRANKLIKKLFNQKQQIRILHNDIQQWNVKLHRGRLCPFDFEDLMIGHPLMDIATTFYHIQSQEEFTELCDAFQQGYKKIYPWPELQAGQLDTLRSGRGVMLANLVIQSSDPEHKEMALNFVKNIEKRLRKYLKS
jgi:Ser/Thr protein kinase RdoA (MazF antagonist)